MNDGWGAIFLGVIAVSTLVMAAIQVGAIVYAARLGRRVEQLSEQIERDIRPVLVNLVSISTNAVRASDLAVAQVQRADGVFSDLTERLDQTLSLVQAAIIAPIREGRAVMTAVCVAVAAFRELRQNSASRSGRTDDEDALFIG